MQVLLLLIALLAAWMPPEVFPWTGALLLAGLLATLPWTWRRRGGAWYTLCPAPTALFAGWIVLGLATAWDRSAAAEQLALLSAIGWAAWAASRERPPRDLPALLGLGLALLTGWAVWQVLLGGFEQTAHALSTLPESSRAAALERLRTGRAFAGLGLPGHLGVLLATAIPLLLGGHRGWSRRWRYAAVALAVLGLLLARSVLPALLGAAALVVTQWRGLSARLAGALLIAVGLVGAVALWRPDFIVLEPVLLRLGNWRSALWVWSTQPITGAGLGGFAQAAQQVPFDVGNEVRHVHSLPLELLADLGLPGLLAVGAVAAWLADLVRRLWSDHRDLAVALTVVPIHNLADFSIYAWGVAVPWAVLVGWATATERGRVVSPVGNGRWRPLALAGALALTGLAVLHAASVDLEWRSRVAASTTHAEQLAWNSAALAPWRVSPLYLHASAALRSGRPEDLQRARASLGRARWLRPRSSVLALLEAEVELASRDLAGGFSAAFEAAWRRPGRSGQLLGELLRETGGRRR